MTTKNIAGIFLPFYLLVAVSISLSYIHIEDTGDACSLVNSDAYHAASPHLMLHELIFAHCSNWSDHAAVPALERTRDRVVKNSPGRFWPDAAAHNQCATSRPVRPANSEIAAGFGPCPDITGFTPVVFAHPPPYT